MATPLASLAATIPVQLRLLPMGYGDASTYVTGTVARIRRPKTWRMRAAHGPSTCTVSSREFRDRTERTNHRYARLKHHVDVVKRREVQERVGVEDQQIRLGARGQRTYHVW